MAQLSLGLLTFPKSTLFCMAFHAELRRVAFQWIYENYYCRRTLPKVDTSPNGFDIHNIHPNHVLHNLIYSLIFPICFRMISCA
jgi:hypothetical protein